jgi:hypothetical protein
VVAAAPVAIVWRGIVVTGSALCGFIRKMELDEVTSTCEKGAIILSSDSDYKMTGKNESAEWIKNH